MRHRLPLSGITIVERVHPAASPVTHHAIALAGRIALDLGANVVRLRAHPLEAGTGPAGSPSASDGFLNSGKPLLDQIPRADAVLTDQPDALALAFRDIPIKVIVAHGVPADLGIADTEGVTANPLRRRTAGAQERAPISP